MYVLGLSAFYHDSAAALLSDGAHRRRGRGRALQPAQARRALPAPARSFCLEPAGHRGSTRVDHVVFYDKPFLKFERLLETYLAFAPRGFRSFRMAIPVWLREKLFLKDLLLQAN